MSKGRILVVDDEHDIANMLKIYFTGQGYDVDVAARGADALQKVGQQLPSLLILDIMLPDMDGYSLLSQLRTNTRTKHIPAIFLTQKDERADRIAGLELGADDYITKPFDIEELALRIANSIRAAERMGLTDPRSGLPSGRLIEDELREMIRREAWAYFDMRVNHFDDFRDKYGFVAGDDVLRFSAMLMSEIVDAKGSAADFIGHAGGDNFILITTPEKAEGLKDTLVARFDQEVQGNYSYTDREKGGMMIEDSDGKEKLVELMTLSIGVVTSERGFADIREVTEAAAEARRKAQSSA
jgi:PleD family two-component response regulator